MARWRGRGGRRGIPHRSRRGPAPASGIPGGTVRRRFRTTVLVVVPCIVLGACGDDGRSRGDVLGELATEVAIPRFDTFASTATSVSDAVDLACDEPTEENVSTRAGEGRGRPGCLAVDPSGLDRAGHGAPLRRARRVADPCRRHRRVRRRGRAGLDHAGGRRQERRCRHPRLVGDPLRTVGRRRRRPAERQRMVRLRPLGGERDHRAGRPDRGRLDRVVPRRCVVRRPARRR